MEDLKKLIREVPGFPKPGILFYDITTLLKDPGGLRSVIDGLHDRYREAQVDVVLGVEARGFIFAPALAYALGAGFVPVRKPKKLPAECVRVTYDLEYGSDCLEMHRDAVGPGTRVLIVDDLLATGGTAAAVARMVSEVGGDGGGHRIRRRADLPQRAPETGRLRRLLAAPIRPMSAPRTRRARVGALAKINLDLRVLEKRAGRLPRAAHHLPDHFAGGLAGNRLHARRAETAIELDDALAIADNLVVRAARLALEAMGAAGRVEMRLDKRIPMGAGLGGGSSDAAAVLLALPVLAGGALELARPGRARPRARQRRAVLPAGRRARPGSAAARSFSRCPIARRPRPSGGPPGACFHRRGLSRAQPSFDN